MSLEPRNSYSCNQYLWCSFFSIKMKCTGDCFRITRTILKYFHILISVDNLETRCFLLALQFPSKQIGVRPFFLGQGELMKSMWLITLASHGVPCGIKPNLVKYGDLKSPTALHLTSHTSYPSKKDEMEVRITTLFYWIGCLLLILNYFILLKNLE